MENAGQTPKKNCISVRPSKAFRSQIERLAKELGKSEGQILNDCAEAVVGMIISREPVIPRMVTMVRALRKADATLISEHRAFGGRPEDRGSSISSHSFTDKKEITALVQNLVPLRLLGSIPAGTPADAGDSDPEVIYVSTTKSAGVDFALRVHGVSMNAAKDDPILDGQIVLLANPEKREPRDNDIVAALCDGEVTLKRYHISRGRKPFLQAESTDPAFGGKVYEASEGRIQGVFMRKF